MVNELNGPECRVIKIRIVGCNVVVDSGHFSLIITTFEEYNRKFLSTLTRKMCSDI